jgi:hypothetical protein
MALRHVAIVTSASAEPNPFHAHAVAGEVDHDPRVATLFLLEGRSAHSPSRRVLRKSEFLHSRLDKLRNQGRREWLVDRKVQRPLRPLIAGKLTT